MRWFTIIALALILPLPAQADWKAPREALDQRTVDGDYAVFYTRQGPHTFPANPAQASQANAYLSRLQAQIALADRVYREDLGLVRPLSMPRYGAGRRIDLHIYDIGRGMGSAGDELQTFDYARFGTEGPVLTIAMSHRWTPPNRTPEHEVFHAYQYAYTFFKNPWYLEGLARSMENPFRDARWKSEPLPADDDALIALQRRSYDAHTFWTRLALLCDPACSQAQRTPTTVGSRAKGAVCGRAIVRPLLEAFDIEDDRASRDRGLSHDYWPEKEQRSTDNFPYMLAGLKRVVAAHCPVDANAELGAFHALLDRHTGGDPEARP